jgi:nucleotide-binding universal stress UspA family protein
VILAAVDNSEYAELVAGEAARKAREKKMDVVFLSVVPVPSLAGSEGEIDAAYLSEREGELQRLHNRLIDSYFTPESGILIESRILHGDPADKIVKYADETNADLIIIGSRGPGRLASVLLGSVSERVARHSKRSVLIVKK